MRVLKTRMPVAAAATVALAVVALGGCSKPLEVKEADAPTEQSQEAQPQSEPEVVQSGVEEDYEEGELPEPVEEDYWGLSSSASPGVAPDGAAIVTGFDVSTDSEYDRFTITLTGEGPVGWDARYVEQAVEVGRGEVIAVDGQAFLDIGITGVSIPETDEDYAVYYQGNGISSPGVAGVYDGTFEGVAHFVIGMDSPRQFDMFMLANPLRVIVDIKK